MQVQGQQQVAFSDKWKWGAASEQEIGILACCGAVTAWLEVFALLHKPRSGTLAYLVMMAARLLQLHRVLKPSGSLYLHCDDSAGHYLKLLLDAIFTPENFLGQIAWVRVTGGKSVTKRNFQRVHDTIFVYRKSAQCAAPRFKNGVLNGKTVRPSTHYSKERFTSPPSMSAAMFNLKGDLWNDAKVKPIGSRSKERTGYPTQKPLTLLERIIRSGSSPGDTVLDPFMGAGTTIAAAEKLGRNWVGIDMGELSLTVTQERLRKLFHLEAGGGYEVWRSHVDIPQFEQHDSRFDPTPHNRKTSMQMETEDDIEQ